jgi:hypothetical protein
MDAAERTRRIHVVASVLSRASYERFSELMACGLIGAESLEGEEFARMESIYKELHRN